jgi:hypothetical protein
MQEYVRLSMMMLASIEYQRRYVVNGTREEHRLPDEIYFDAVEGAEHETEGVQGKSPESLTERDPLREFLTTVSPLPNDFIARAATWEDLIERDPRWAIARNAAITCLTKLGLPMPPRDWEGS